MNPLENLNQIEIKTTQKEKKIRKANNGGARHLTLEQIFDAAHACINLNKTVNYFKCSIDAFCTHLGRFKLINGLGLLFDDVKKLPNTKEAFLILAKSCKYEETDPNKIPLDLFFKAISISKNISNAAYSLGIVARDLKLQLSKRFKIKNGMKLTVEYIIKHINEGGDLASLKEKIEPIEDVKKRKKNSLKNIKLSHLFNIIANSKNGSEAAGEFDIQIVTLNKNLNQLQLINGECLTYDIVYFYTKMENGLEELRNDLDFDSVDQALGELNVNLRKLTVQYFYDIVTMSSDITDVETRLKVSDNKFLYFLAGFKLPNGENLTFEKIKQMKDAKELSQLLGLSSTMALMQAKPVDLNSISLQRLYDIIIKVDTLFKAAIHLGVHAEKLCVHIGQFKTRSGVVLTFDFIKKQPTAQALQFELGFQSINQMMKPDKFNFEDLSIGKILTAIKDSKRQLSRIEALGTTKKNITAALKKIQWPNNERLTIISIINFQGTIEEAAQQLGFLSINETLMERYTRLNLDLIVPDKNFFSEDFDKIIDPEASNPVLKKTKTNYSEIYQHPLNSEIINSYIPPFSDLTMKVFESNANTARNPIDLDEYELKPSTLINNANNFFYPNFQEQKLEDNFSNISDIINRHEEQAFYYKNSNFLDLSSNNPRNIKNTQEHSNNQESIQVPKLEDNFSSLSDIVDKFENLGMQRSNQSNQQISFFNHASNNLQNNKNNLLSKKHKPYG